MRATRVPRVVGSSPDSFQLQIRVLVIAVGSQVFLVLAYWFPGPELLWDQTITPEMLDPDYRPWIGILGWLPVLPALLAALVVWSFLSLRRVTQAHIGNALVLCAYGLLARNVGAFGAALNGSGADPTHAPFGKALLYSGDCAVLLGFACWLVLTLVGLRHALRRRRSRAHGVPDRSAPR